MLKVQEIRELIKLVDQSAIDEFTYESEGTTVTMKKSGESSGAKPIERGAAVEEPAVEPVKVKETQVQEVKKEEKVESDEQPADSNTDYDHEIVSPMVGTLYIAPNPESGSFVENGSKVEKDSVVCIVEAMKLFNEIEAEISGEIVEILVDDGELVEYGQPLFRVKTK